MTQGRGTISWAPRKEGRKEKRGSVGTGEGKGNVVTHLTSASDAQDNGGFYSVGVPYSAMEFYRFSSAVKSEALGITLIYRAKAPARGSDLVRQTDEIKAVPSFWSPTRSQPSSSSSSSEGDKS